VWKHPISWIQLAKKRVALALVNPLTCRCVLWILLITNLSWSSSSSQLLHKHSFMLSFTIFFLHQPLFCRNQLLRKLAFTHVTSPLTLTRNYTNQLLPKPGFTRTYHQPCLFSASTCRSQVVSANFLQTSLSDAHLFVCFFSFVCPDWLSTKGPQPSRTCVKTLTTSQGHTGRSAANKEDGQDP
jgi:hypothetical protein